METCQRSAMPLGEVNITAECIFHFRWNTLALSWVLCVEIRVSLVVCAPVGSARSTWLGWSVVSSPVTSKQPTCSSSTLAASGRASDARTIIVDRTMVSDKVCKDVDTLVAVIPLTSRDCLENALQKMTNGAKCQCMILDCPSTSCEACKE